MDYFGNHVTWFSVQEPHTELTITANSEVEVSLDPPAGCIQGAVLGGGPRHDSQFALASVAVRSPVHPGLTAHHSLARTRRLCPSLFSRGTPIS